MSPIRLLPPGVADAIAAGEVVERPASVVKELCENAIDAGAGRIDVAVDGGGTARIRVVDDGSGIPGDELQLAVARHATSKIETAGDLASVATLGFRGEALASIAAVAEVIITTRPAGAGGARIDVRASRVVASGPAACAPGTTVEVLDLFFATPARLRFLRSPRTETAAAARIVSDLALSHPGVAMTCAVDGRVALRSPGGSLRDALVAVFGSAADELVDVAGETHGVAVGGAISQPRAHRGTRGQVVLVVNGRRVHNRALGVAVEEAYRGLLPGGRWPFGVVMITLDAEDVDVNVHPGKREVRFRDDARVFGAVQRACWEAVASARPYVVGASGGLLVGEGAPASRASGPRMTVLGRPAPATSPGSPDRGPSWRPLVRRADLAADSAPAPVASPDSLGALAPLRALGQAGGAWLVAESPAGVVLVDPHAAHEKVLYAELLEAWAAVTADGGAAPSQLLLLPATIELDPAGVAVLEEEAERVGALGFAVDPFGPGSVRCSAVPAACAVADPGRLVRDLVESLAEAAGAERDHRLAALLACHSAVRLGDVLAPEQQQRLLDRLTATPGGVTCPHGRPTVLVLDHDALRRAFRRPAAG